MADRPILFSGAMVRALLAGTKTQTRRIIAFAGVEYVMDFVKVGTDSQGRSVYEMKDEAGLSISRPAGKGLVDYHFSPRIAVGDRLWVRESGYLLREAYDHDPATRNDLWRDAGFQHTADGVVVPIRAYDPPIDEWIDDCGRNSRPSIHMPRWASRLTLTVTDVRVERLQDISREDAISEGLEWVAPTYGVGGIASTWNGDPRESYFALWGHINGAGAAAGNPWVVAYSFTVERGNIDQIGRAAA